MDPLSFVASVSGMISIADEIGAKISHLSEAGKYIDPGAGSIVRDERELGELLQDVSRIVLNSKELPPRSAIRSLESCKSSAMQLGSIIEQHRLESGWKRRFKQKTYEKNIESMYRTFRESVLLLKDDISQLRLMALLLAPLIEWQFHDTAAFGAANASLVKYLPGRYLTGNLPYSREKLHYSHKQQYRLTALHEETQDNIFEM
jgi:hypothetical protein